MKPVKTSRILWCSLPFFLIFLFLNYSCTSEFSEIDQLFEVKEGTLNYNGYAYKTITIGSQEWTVENLRTTFFNDSTEISFVSNKSEWPSLTSEAYCYYDLYTSSISSYGCLYNWYAINSGKLAPAGWKIPDESDWNKLIEFIGGASKGGKKLKSKSEWTNTGDNDFHFSALPAGRRNGLNGNYEYKGSYSNWWCLSSYAANQAKYASILNNNDEITLGSLDKRFGLSVRLVRDIQ